MIKQKGLRIILITLLSVLTMSCFSIFIYNVMPLKKQSLINPVKAEVGAFYYYDFAEGALNGSRYPNSQPSHDVIYDEVGDEDCPFIISSTDAYNYFIETLENKSYLGYPYDFANKYVVLTADLDFDGKTFTPIGTESRPFRGTFDGQGYTISNIASVTDCSGLFGCLSTIETYTSSIELDKTYSDDPVNVVVQNLKVKTVGGTTTESIGGIANVIKTEGNYTVTIQNCVVDTFYVSSNKKNNHIGGIVGEATHVDPSSSKPNLIIEDCLVYDFKIVTSEQTIKEGASSIGPSYSMSLDNGYDDIYNSFDLKDCVAYCPESTFIDTYHDEGGVQNVDNIWLHSIGGVWSKASNDAGDGYSSTWYYNSEYKNGCPYLREFLEWDKIWISVNPTSYGTVTHSSITVPSDFDFDKEYTSNTETITIFGTKVTAKPNAGCYFDSWTKKGPKSYVVTFTQTTYIIKFEDPSSNSPIEFSYVNRTWTVAPNTEIYVYLNKKSGNPLKEDAYYSLSFNNNGKSNEYSIKQDEMFYFISKEVVLDFMKQVLKYNGDCRELNHEGNYSGQAIYSFTVHSDITINAISATEKQYNSTFGEEIND